MAIASLLACVALGPGAPSAAAATLGCADDASRVTDLSSWAPEMLAATNQHRASLGLAALQLDPTLARASTWKARDMARRDYFAHDDPAGADGSPARTPWERLTACGFPSDGSKAENIAAGRQSGAAFVQAWIDSPGHRANIENATLRFVGFGVASSTTSRYGTYAVQMFSSIPGSTAAEPTRTVQEGGGSTTDAAPAPLAMAASARVTRFRCRSSLAVGGYCHRLRTRGTLSSADAGAAAGRRIVVTRRTASGRYLLVARTTTRADGSFVAHRIVRPPAAGTRAWVLRNARVVRVRALPTGELPGRVSLRLARVRM